MDIHKKLQRLLDERGWTTYRLSKECGLSDSTIGNIFRRNTDPSLSSLEAICSGFGITLAQFFAEDDMIELTPPLKELFNQWITLTPRQKQTCIEIMKVMNNDEET